MIIVDNALKARAARGEPIRVGLVGAGFMGRAITRQISQAVPGMDIVAIANRTLGHAERACLEAGLKAQQVDTVDALEAAVAAGHIAITENPELLGAASGIDVVIEATGTVEWGAKATLAALEGKKHVILVNAELDGTLGPILKTYADRAGVVLSGCDGDQPGAELNLYRYVKGIGMEPLVCGNIKGLMDHYRTPKTQQGFAQRWDQDPYMVTSFADGSKISFEQALVANATGMTVARRGMVGYAHEGFVDEPEHLALYDIGELRDLGGVVDYALGAKPGPGVFVLAAQPRELERRYLDLYKMGRGPLYAFYTPFHLCYFEVPLTVGRAVLFGDAAIAPLAGPVVEVVATAKHDLKAGETLDGIGGYALYGQCERADLTQREKLLPIGLADGCTLRRDVAKNRVLTYDDVVLPKGRLSDKLRAEQNEQFFGVSVITT